VFLTINTHNRYIALFRLKNGKIALNHFYFNPIANQKAFAGVLLGDGISKQLCCDSATGPSIRGSEGMYELRFYSVASGRMAAEVQRVYDVAIAGAPAEVGGPPAHPESLWDRYRIPRPAGAWTVTAGPRAPGFLFILKWDDFKHRDSAYPRFWGDKYWQAIRAKGADGSPLVDNIEDWIMRPSAAWDSLRDPASYERIGGVHEMRVQHVPSGTQGEAARILAEVDLPLARKLGAKVLGVFELLFGLLCPSFVTFLAWPDFETQQRASARLDVEPRVWKQREREMEQHKRRVFGRIEQYILDPVPDWGKPMANFGESK